jgi:hypothetical protein
MAIWNILQTFGIFFNHLVHFVFVWYVFSGFGMMYQEKSGNSGANASSSYYVSTGLAVVKQLDSIESYKMNLLNKSLSMNVFWMRGMAFIPDKMEPDIDKESDASTYTGVHCLDVIFKRGIC